MTLGLDDATTADSRFEAVVVELFDIDILNGLPVREEEFHRCGCYALDSLEVAHIGILVVFYKLVEEHAVDVLCAQGVHDFGEVFDIDSPAFEYHIFGDSWEVPSLDEAVEAVQ